MDTWGSLSSFFNVEVIKWTSSNPSHSTNSNNFPRTPCTEILTNNFKIVISTRMDSIYGCCCKLLCKEIFSASFYPWGWWANQNYMDIIEINIKSIWWGAVWVEQVLLFLLSHWFQGTCRWASISSTCNFIHRQSCGAHLLPFILASYSSLSTHLSQCIYFYPSNH